MTSTNIESQDCIIYLLWEYANHPSVELSKINPLWMDTYHQTLYDQIVGWDKQRDLALFCLENGNTFSILWFKCKTAGVLPESFAQYCGLQEEAYNTISVWKLLEDSKFLSAAEAVREVQKFTEKLSDARLTELELSMPKEMAYIFADMIEKARLEKEPDLKTGFPILDKVTWGLRKGEILTIGARTSRGKSAFALNVSRHLVNKGKKVLYFSTEMSAYEKVKRLASMETGIEGWKFRQAKFEDHEWVEVGQFVEKYAGDNFYICDKVSPNIETIRACIKKIKPDVMVVDYLGLCRLPKADRLDLSIGEFMKQLKAMSRSEKVATIVISQLNRQVDARTDKVPTLADLKESGSIEQESDVVILLYDEPNQDINNSVRNLILSVEKNRHGYCRRIKLVFRTETLQMAEQDQETEKPKDYKLAG